MNRIGCAMSPGSRSGGCPPGHDWIPLLLAVLIHAAVGAMAHFSPSFSPRRPVLPEIHTVNLFSAVETPSAPAPKTAPARIEPAAPAPADIRTMESAPVKKEVAPPVPKEPPISERPLRAKTAGDEAKLRELRAKMAAQDALEKQKMAEREIEKALANIRDLHKAEATAPVQPSPAPAARPAKSAAGEEGGQATTAFRQGGGQGAVMDVLERRYLADLHMRIQQHWKLPDLQSWDKSLEARYAININSNGIITESFFISRSQSFHFDRFVEKAIRDASPLPPFPRDWKRNGWRSVFVSHRVRFSNCLSSLRRRLRSH